MKIINMSFLAVLLLVGTDLVARAAMQGVEARTCFNGV